MAFNKIVWYGIGSSLLFLAACSGKSPQAGNPAVTETTIRQPAMNSQEPPGRASTPPPGPESSPDRIPPGSCRLVGKVISVLPDLESDKNTICGQVPCRAAVQIQSIIGYGSAFGQPLAHGQEIVIYFHFTLRPTGRFFPELTTPLPGLKPGDIFQADVTRAGDGAPRSTAGFQVYRYTLKK